MPGPIELPGGVQKGGKLEDDLSAQFGDLLKEGGLKARLQGMGIPPQIFYGFEDVVFSNPASFMKMVQAYSRDFPQFPEASVFMMVSGNLRGAYEAGLLRDGRWFSALADALMSERSDEGASRWPSAQLVKDVLPNLAKTGRIREPEDIKPAVRVLDGLYGGFKSPLKREGVDGDFYGDAILGIPSAGMALGRLLESGAFEDIGGFKGLVQVMEASAGASNYVVAYALPLAKKKGLMKPGVDARKLAEELSRPLNSDDFMRSFGRSLERNPDYAFLAVAAGVERDGIYSRLVSDIVSKTGVDQGMLERSCLFAGKTWYTAFAATLETIERLENPRTLKGLNERYGLIVFGRYTPELIKSVHEMDEGIIGGRIERPEYSGLIIQPLRDPTEAYFNTGFIQTLVQTQGARVAEVADIDQFVVAVKKHAEAFGPLNYLVIGGHGTASTTELGPISSKGVETLTIDNVGRIAQELRGCFKEGATIIMNSCHTGMFGGLAQRLSGKMGLTVLAAEEEVYVWELGLKENAGGLDFNVVYVDERHNIQSVTPIKYVNGNRL